MTAKMKAMTIPCEPPSNWPMTMMRPVRAPSKSVVRNMGISSIPTRDTVRPPRTPVNLCRASLLGKIARTYPHNLLQQDSAHQQSDDQEHTVLQVQLDSVE